MSVICFTTQHKASKTPLRIKDLHLKFEVEFRSCCYRNPVHHWYVCWSCGQYWSENVGKVILSKDCVKCNCLMWNRVGLIMTRYIPCCFNYFSKIYVMLCITNHQRTFKDDIACKLGSFYSHHHTSLTRSPTSLVPLNRPRHLPG